MLKDRYMVWGTGIILIGFVLGMLIRGFEEESVLENKRLAVFERPTLHSFIDTSFQSNFEEALSDQMLFGTYIKKNFQRHKDMNTALMHQIIDGAWKEEVIEMASMDASVIEAEPNEQQPEETHSNAPVIDYKKITEADEALDKRQHHFEMPDTQTLAQSEPRTTEVTEASETTEKAADARPLARAIEHHEKEGMNQINLKMVSEGQFYIELFPRGSGLMQVVGTNHLISAFLPLSKTQKKFDARAKQINEFADAHPNVQFASFYIETDLDIDFVKGTMPHDNVNYFSSLLNDKIIFDALKIQSPEQFLDYYYKTDHHWDTSGQIAAYNRLINVLFGEGEPRRTISAYLTDLPFVGYKGRLLNDTSTKDAFKFIHAPLPPYEVTINDVPGSYNKKYKYLKEIVPIIEALNYYGDCNGGDFGKVTFDFNQPDKPNALVFVESFSNPLKEIIASHFNQTTYIDVRYYAKTFGEPFSMSAYLEKHPADLVLFFGYYTFYDGLLPSVNP